MNVEATFVLGHVVGLGQRGLHLERLGVVSRLVVTCTRRVVPPGDDDGRHLAGNDLADGFRRERLVGVLADVRDGELRAAA